MKVSVITPCYNRPKMLQYAIHSFSEQMDRCYSNTIFEKEMVIVNDGGMDNLKDIVNGFNDNRLKYYYKKNGGVGSALNYAVEKSTGDYFCLLPDDDLLYGEHSISDRLRLLLANDVDCIYTDVVGVDQNGNQFEYYPAEKPNKKRIWKEDYINTLGLFWRREVFDKIGNFDKTLLCNDDWDFKIRLLFGVDKIKYFNFPSAKYRRHLGAKSRYNKETGLRDKAETYIKNKIREEYKDKYDWL